MKIHPVGSKLLHAYRRADRHNKTNHLFEIFRKHQKKEWLNKVVVVLYHAAVAG